MSILRTYLTPARTAGVATFATSATRSRPVLQSVANVADVAVPAEQAWPSRPEGDTPDAWLKWHAAETSRRQVAGHDEISAARLAYGIAQIEWHARYGERRDDNRCAGCGGSLAGLVLLGLADGAAVHGDDRLLVCTSLYGDKWRGAAAQGLAQLGIRQPGEQP